MSLISWSSLRVKTYEFRTNPRLFRVKKKVLQKSSLFLDLEYASR